MQFNKNMFGEAGKKAKGTAGMIVRVVVAILVILVLVTPRLGMIYSVSEQQQAVVTMFGNVVAVRNAGMYFKIPFIQTVYKVDTTTHGTGIGYVVSETGQNLIDETNGIMITSDFNFVNIDFYMEYKVSDPVAYLFNSPRPEAILSNMALAAIRSTVIDYPVDEVITTAKSQIQASVREKLAVALETNNIGLQVVNITIQDAEPPTQEIVGKFKEVETAKQSKDTAINNANQYRNEQLPAAQAEADRILQSAEAAKSSRIADAEGQAERFTRMYEEYQNYPAITRKRLFYEAMEEILPNLKVIVTDGSTQQVLPLENFANIAAGGGQ